MIHRELHVDEIRIPNVERVGRGLVPGSETVRQGVTGPAEGKVHPDRSIFCPVYSFERVGLSGSGRQNENGEHRGESFVIHGGL